ncbi:MAG: SH3 domain-containing protein, partial [Candidatus Cloacimonetes bacterium]|nr:SH3 domain-containing protein [Candidatus Cloacimonadota bacterium]
IFLFIFLVATLSCCTGQKNKKVLAKQPESINDIHIYPQDPLYYANLFNPDSLLISHSQQEELYDRFLKRFYRVWKDSLHLDSPRTQEVMTYHKSEISKLFKNAGYGENKQRRDSLFASTIFETADLSDSLNTMRQGIMISHTDIRVVPSIKPFFRNFALAGEGYPFDYWQNSTIPIGTPIFVYHISGNWALIDSHICSGWIPRNTYLYLSKDQTQEIMTMPLIAVIKDQTALFNQNESYVGKGDIGTILPMLIKEDDNYIIPFFTQNNSQEGEKQNLVLSVELAVEIPIPMTPINIALLCTEMMGQVYGWGGMYQNRDCSQTMLDLFAPFGILLPRNSRAQAYNYGVFKSTKEIAGVSARKDFIIQNAMPFQTLVRTPGHIMLYIGYIESEPLVFHSMWGVRTLDKRKQEGRHIIGRTVITTLEPGKELPNVANQNTLINRVEGITFIRPKK